MSDQCLSSTENTNFSTLLISDLILLCSFLLSHPLYSMYIIFFSPYLLKLVSFLSPLFITTSLSIITLFTTISPGLNSDDNLSTSVFHAVLKKLQPGIGNEEEESICFVAFEVYNFVFDTSMIDFKDYQVDDSEENPEERILQTVESSVMIKIPHQNLNCCVLEREALTKASEQGLEAVKQENRSEDFMKLLNKFESMKCNVDEKKVDPPPPARKVKKATEKRREESFVLNGYETSDNGRVNSSKSNAHSQIQSAGADRKDSGRDYFPKEEGSLSLEFDLGRYGSMRKEKEWRKTLACKLFEERNNVDGSEGMDSLWEAYETGATNGNTRADTKKKREKSTKCKMEYYKDEEDGNDKKEDYDDDDDDDDDDIVGQLCCLQAFKVSAGKMNLGVGKRNLARISKAVKGFGWLHRVSRHGKKVHIGDTFRFA